MAREAAGDDLPGGNGVVDVDVTEAGVTRFVGLEHLRLPRSGQKPGVALR